MKTIIAAYCYKGKKKNHKILLITSSMGRWIIPKGHAERTMKKREVALLEAWEEGGINGRITGKSKAMIINIGEPKRWEIFPVEITKMTNSWPEKASRKRCLVKVGKAIKLINNDDLAKAVKEISDRVLEAAYSAP